MEIVHEGWLTKSPPSKPIWRARWRRRWFVLRHSGELPGQYFLEYYTDRNRRKLKGKIDLDQCEQVDAGLTFQTNKQKYQYLFDVKTRKRIYYLAAESEEDMNKWVEYVCHVCGLKAYKDDAEEVDYCPTVPEEVEVLPVTAESPPVSPASTISGPYIPISECISGKPLTNFDCVDPLPVCNGVGSQTYDLPRKLQPPNLVLKPDSTSTPPLHSPTTDGESVFDDDEWTSPVVNWDTFPTDGLSETDSCNVARRFARLTIVDGEAPPRPPKPAHLVDPSPPPVHNAADETYDFPRSHPPPNGRNCYSNAAPGEVFRYDFPIGELPVGSSVEPASPHSAHSESSSSVYSNLPSPLYGPVVNRELKPGRKTSDSASITSEPSPGGPRVMTLPPPNINRRLKPPRRTASEQGSSLSQDGPRKKIRAAPSPIPTSRSYPESISDEEPHMYFVQNNGQFVPANMKSSEGIHYLDLDLTSESASASPGATPTTPVATVYKTVDFLKTEAFNRTRQEVEEGRKQCTAE